jgi:hypothetical protein
MRINAKTLSIPPYISTAWKNVLSLHIEETGDYPLLVVTLANQTRIEIPRLDLSLMDAVFAAHEKHLNAETELPPTLSKSLFLPLSNEEPSPSPFHFNAGNLESVSAYLQHNAEQMNSPNLPPEVLNKVSALSKTVGITDPNILPKAEPHCNCPHCQIARAIQNGIDNELTSEETIDLEEEVSEEDLTFRTWDIHKTSDNLYLVMNPLDDVEHYSVYLGDPIGCTCGCKNCEHIEAVLKS